MISKTILYFVSILNVAFCNIILGENQLLIGYKISYGAYETLSIIGMARCQRECLTRRKCQSIEYNKQTLECTFGKFKDKKSFTGIRTDLYIVPNWNKIPDSLGPCRYGQCSAAAICVPLSSGNSMCVNHPQALDLTILVDVSKSIKSSGFNAIRNMVQRLIDLFDRNTWDLRLGYVFFCGYTIINFRLDTYITKDDQREAVGNLGYPSRLGNELGGALMTISKEIYSGSPGDRPGQQNVILVILDPSDTVLTDLATNADKVKAAGINILALGKTTSDSGKMVLHTIVSEPLADNTVTFASFADLVGMERSIFEAIGKFL